MQSTKPSKLDRGHRNMSRHKKNQVLSSGDQATSKKKCTQTQIADSNLKPPPSPNPGEGVFKETISKSGDTSTGKSEHPLFYKSEDLLLAERLQKEENDGFDVNKADAEIERDEMMRTPYGKAVVVVQEILELVEIANNKYPSIDPKHNVDSIAKDDMVYFARGMLELQEQFFVDEVSTMIDVGFHYTDQDHLDTIRTDGLLTKSDRHSKQIDSVYHGSWFGDGVYTCSNYTSFSKYGNVGLIVGRLQGKTIRMAGKIPRTTMAGFNTIIGDKLLQSGFLDKTGWPLSDKNNEIVLRSSAQCFPMIKFDASLINSQKGERCIQFLESSLKSIFDKAFNEGSKPHNIHDLPLISFTGNDGSIASAHQAVSGSQQHNATPAVNSSHASPSIASAPKPFSSAPQPFPSAPTHFSSAPKPSAGVQSKHPFSSPFGHKSPVLQQKTATSTTNSGKINTNTKFSAQTNMSSAKSQNGLGATKTTACGGSGFASGGFSFGGSAPQSSFGGAASAAKNGPTTNLATGGFSFGSCSTSHSSKSPSATGGPNPVGGSALQSSFGGAASAAKNGPTTTAATGGFSFGTFSPPQSSKPVCATGGPNSFRANAPQSSFGGTASATKNGPTTTAATGWFSFGTYSPPQSSTPGSATGGPNSVGASAPQSSFGGAASAAKTRLTTSVATGGFSFSDSSKSASATGGLNSSGSNVSQPSFGGATSATRNGATATAATGGFSFGGFNFIGANAPALTGVAAVSSSKSTPATGGFTFAGGTFTSNHANVPKAPPPPRSSYSNSMVSGLAQVVPYVETIQYKSPQKLTAFIPIDTLVPPPFSCDRTKDCLICHDTLSTRQCASLNACKHLFHRECIKMALDSKPQCPLCRKSVGAPQGKSPSGTMEVSWLKESCAGSNEDSFVITYIIPSGTQKEYHENPGQRHGEKVAKAYLPNNVDGQNLLKRLKFAFRHGLTFTVGTSLTTGLANQCTWSAIHHKTSLNGGVQRHGFPDNCYFFNVNGELDGQGVPAAHLLGKDGKEKIQDPGVKSSSGGTFVVGSSTSASSCPQPPGGIGFTAGGFIFKPHALQSSSKGAVGANFAATSNAPTAPQVKISAPLSPSAWTSKPPAVPPSQSSSKGVVGADFAAASTPNAPLANISATLSSSTGSSKPPAVPCSKTLAKTATQIVVSVETLEYESPPKLTTFIPADTLVAAISNNLSKDCIICQDTLTSHLCAALKICKHVFHQKCIKKALDANPQCPSCRKSVGAPQGKSPSGKMEVSSSSKSCADFKEDSIVITYTIPSGTQKDYHENPGQHHGGGVAKAYLPNNIDGRDVLKRLKFAFMHGLTFTVGTSPLTGNTNQCTWSIINHKTSLNGGVQSHGFPDKDYFKKINQELDGNGVPAANLLGDDGTEYTCVVS